MHDEQGRPSARGSTSAGEAAHDRDTDPIPERLPEGVDRFDATGARVLDLAALERADAAPAWSVDLDGAPPARSDVGLRRRLRRWQVLALVAVLLAVAAGVAAGVTARRGEQWRRIAIGQRDRATALAASVEAANAAVSAAEEVALAAETARREADSRRDVAEDRLLAQEQDVVALEERVAALAAEKARLEDRLVVAGEARRLTSSADAALVGCVQQVEAWLARAPDDPPPDGAVDAAAWAAWSGEAATWRASCADALATARG